MSKRKTGWTEAKISRYIKEGRGQGELSLYKPWLTIQDVPSNGRVHRTIGWKTEREHHLLSDLELSYLSICDWANNVVDIREHFPLNREVTLAIAEELEVQHPVDLKNTTPSVMTTDFFLSVREGKRLIYKARTIKHSMDLNNKRVVEKLEIERLYWKRQGINWAIATEEEIPKVFLNNLKFLRESFHIEDNERLQLFLNDWPNFNGILIENLRAFDQKYNFELGTGISLYKYSLARKFLAVDMNKKIDLKESIKNIKVLKHHNSDVGWAK